MPWPMRLGPPPRIMILRRVRLRLALLLVGRVQVGGRGREFRRAGVDALVHRTHPQLVALAADRPRSGMSTQCARRRSEKPMRLSDAQPLGAERAQAVARARSASCRDQLLDLRQEPGIDMRSARRCASSVPAGAERVRDVQQAIGARGAQLVAPARACVSSDSGSDRQRRPGRRARSRARAAPSAATPGRCGRSPSPRRPTSSAWSAGRSRPGISRR